MLLFSTVWDLCVVTHSLLQKYHDISQLFWEQKRERHPEISMIDWHLILGQ